MKRRSILLLSGAALAISAMASPITPEEALARVRANGPSKVAAKAAAAGSTLVYTSVSEDGLKSAYLFNLKDGGYMVLAADDAAFPMLGYSDSGMIDASHISPEMNWWLQEYGRQIDWAVKNNRGSNKLNTRADNSMTAITPMLKSKWSQDAPYNNLCPIPLKVNGQTYTGGVHAYTGCVATSMAQVMYYFKYPEVGTGTIQYTPVRSGYTFDRLTWNLARHPFEWDKMLDNYISGEYTEEQGEAVANLMKSCGVSVEMSYGLDASGASGFVISSALRNYFKYDINCRTEIRDVYSSDDWEKLIYDNLKNVGPTIINGQSPNGGHSFVCDGYDGNGYFHFNWGWSGMSDGYYLLQALNPDAQGIGGYTGGYNFEQNAIIGMMPPKGDNTKYIDPVRIMQYGTATATIDGNIMSFGVRDYRYLGWGNPSDRMMSDKIGAIITRNDDTQASQIVEGYMIGANYSKMEVINLTSQNYYASDRVHPEIVLPDLADGEYTVTLACLDQNCLNPEWVPVVANWGYPNYVKLTVEGGKYTVTDVERAKLVVNNLEIMTDIFYGRKFKIKANITNPSDLQLTGYYSPALYKGNTMMYSGESIGISVEPHETIDFEWVSRFTAESGVSAPSTETTYTLGLYNPNPNANKELYGTFGEVDLKPSPGNSLRMSVVDFSIDGEPGTVKLNGYDKSVTIVKSGEKVSVNLEYRDVAGYFDGQMILALSKNVEGSYGLIPVLDEIASDTPFLSAGETATLKAEFAVPDPEPDVIYSVVAKYTFSSQWRDLAAEAFVIDSAGINGIGMDSDEETEFYNLQGQRVYEPALNEIILVKKGSKVQKMVWKE